MEEITHENAFVPSHIMMIYHNKEKAYIESGKMLFVDGKFTPGAMMPASTKFMTELSNGLVENASTYKANMLNKKLLYIKSRGINRTITWSYKRNDVSLQFSDKIDLEDGIYSLPNLIFQLENDYNLSVYAIVDEEITEKTLMYRAPFGNVYDDHSVCMGNVKKGGKVDDLNKLISHWENLFFNSTFTHTSVDKLVRGNFVSVMKETRAAGIFDDKYLLPTKHTFKSICE